MAPQQLDERGRVKDSITTLREKHLTVGCYVCRKPDADTTDYAIIHTITHDVVTLARLKSTEGSARMLSVPCSEIIEEWRPVVDPEEVRDKGIITNFMLLTPSNDRDYENTLQVHAHLKVLQGAWDHFAAKMIETPFMIGTKPRKHITTTRDVEPNELVFVPYSRSLAFMNPTKIKKGEFAMSLGVESRGVDATEVLHIKPYFVVPKPSEPHKGCVIPFWAVERLDSTKADNVSINMSLSEWRVSGATVFPPLLGHAGAHDQQRFLILLLLLCQQTRHLLVTPPILVMLLLLWVPCVKCLPQPTLLMFP